MAKIQAPDLRRAVYKIISDHIDDIPPEYIFWGNQNNIALPQNSQDYVIFFLLSTVRHGTNIPNYNDAAETESADTELEYTVQVDFYSAVDGTNDGSKAMLRAQTLETLSRMGVLNELIGPSGLHFLFAEDARDTTFVGGDNSYVRRWTVMLHMAGHVNVTIEMPGFTNVDLVPNLVTSKEQALNQEPERNRLGVTDIDVKFS